MRIKGNKPKGKHDLNKKRKNKPKKIVHNKERTTAWPRDEPGPSARKVDSWTIVPRCRPVIR